MNLDKLEGIPGWGKSYINAAPDGDLWGDEESRKEQVESLIELSGIVDKFASFVSWGDLLEAWNQVGSAMQQRYSKYEAVSSDGNKLVKKLVDERVKVQDKFSAQKDFEEGNKYQDLLYELPTVVVVKFFESLPSQS